MVLELGKSKITYEIEYAGKASTDFGKEFLRVTGLSSVLLITKLDISEEDSKIKILQRFCDLYPSVAIIWTLGEAGVPKESAIKLKGIDAIVADAMGFYNISTFFDDEVGYAIVNNSLGYGTYLRVCAYQLAAIAIDMLNYPEVMSCFCEGAGELLPKFREKLSEYVELKKVNAFD